MSEKTEAMTPERSALSRRRREVRSLRRVRGEGLAVRCVFS